MQGGLVEEFCTKRGKDSNQGKSYRGHLQPLPADFFIDFRHPY
jgi:hypothetical protein